MWYIFYCHNWSFLPYLKLFEHLHCYSVKKHHNYNLCDWKRELQTNNRITHRSEISTMSRYLFNQEMTNSWVGGATSWSSLSFSASFSWNLINLLIIIAPKKIKWSFKLYEFVLTDKNTRIWYENILVLKFISLLSTAIANK